MSIHLPWDYCRCNGDGCAKRHNCARYVQLGNMGPRTPIMERCFVDGPGALAETPSYIPIVDSSPAGRTKENHEPI